MTQEIELSRAAADQAGALDQDDYARASTFMDPAVSYEAPTGTITRREAVMASAARGDPRRKVGTSGVPGRSRGEPWWNIMTV